MRASSLLVALAVTVTVTTTLAQQPARDVHRAPRAGTSAIAGVLVIDAPESKPLRRARVTLNDTDAAVGFTTISEDDGSFAFTNIPAGRYALAVSRPGFATTAYGATRPGRPGTRIAVGAGETRRITMRVARGAVLTGTVQDLEGSPVPGITVRAMTYSWYNGERQLMPAGTTAVSDDRGVYRIFGLTAGEYALSASPRGTGYSNTVQRVSAGDVRAAMQELNDARGAIQARPGVGGGASESPMESARTYGFATIYFPGTPSVAEAATVTLAAGEERSGIDFQLQLVPMVKVSGSVTVAEGPLPKAVIVNMMPIGAPPGTALSEGLKIGRAGPDGKFSFTGIQPGRYALMSRAAATATPIVGPAIESSAGPSIFGIAEISVEGSDLTDIVIPLQPGFTVSGRLTFDGTLAPPDPTKFRVGLSPVQGPGEMGLAVPGTKVDEKGEFTVYGVAPGRYRLSAAIPGPQQGQAWWLRTSIVNGRDTLDVPLDVRESVAGAVLTFSDRSSTLAGAALDRAGQPAPGCYVIAATTERGFWARESRRILSARAGSDGKYSIKNLPPGEYYVAAVIDVEQGEWFDQRFLEQFAALAPRVTIAEGEQKVLDVAVVR